MKLLLLLCLPLLSIGCAGTRASSTECYTQANVGYFKWQGGANPSLEMRDVNHSEPTRAGGSVIGTTGTAIGGVGAAFLMRGMR